MVVDRPESSLDGSQKTRMNRWDSMSTDILESIVKRLAFVEKLNWAGVCTYWHCIAKSDLASQLSSTLERPPPPLLVLDEMLSEPEYCPPSCIDHKGSVFCCPKSPVWESVRGSWFYCLKSKKVLKLNNRCEQLKMSTCAGSSNGWLIFTQRGGEEGRAQTLFLYNPLLDVGLRPSSKLSLPFDKHHLQNIILWGNPVSTDLNYSFAIVITTAQSIAFARFGDSNWTLLDSGDYIDVISSKNKVYALTATCGVRAWDFSHSSPLKTLDVKPNLERKTIYDAIMSRIVTKDMSPRPYYLVESNGELLIVTRYHRRRYDQNSKSFKIDPFFWLDKLNFQELKWKEEELRLMDRVIFLGTGQCVSYSTRDLPGYDGGIHCADDPERLGSGYYLVGEKRRKIKLPAFWLLS